MNCLTNQELRSLSEFVLTNSCSVRSTGFYNGKAGMSLGLFEVARYLNDEQIEDQAFDLLQEALLSKNDDISYENGLSGVGASLLYLIEHEYVDAEYEDFFGEQTNKIVSELEKRQYDSAYMLNNFHLVLFLNQVNKFRLDPKIDRLIYLLFEEVERYLSLMLFGFSSLRSSSSHLEMIYAYNDYLRISYLVGQEVSPSLIEVYATNYRKGKLSSIFSIGYYMEKVLNNDLLHEYSDVIQDNKSHSLSNLNPELMTLKELLDILCLLRNDTDNWELYGARLEEYILNHEEKSLEKSVLKTFDNRSFPAGYGFGVARLLSYCSGDLKLM